MFGQQNTELLIQSTKNKNKTFVEINKKKKKLNFE